MNASMRNNPCSDTFKFIKYMLEITAARSARCTYRSKKPTNIRVSANMWLSPICNFIEITNGNLSPQQEFCNKRFQSDSCIVMCSDNCFDVNCANTQLINTWYGMGDAQ